MRFETKVVHSGAGVDEATGAVAPPIHLSTTFARRADGSLHADYGYIRESNPNQQALEQALSDLDGGAGALAFGSGMAAGTALIQALPEGWHIVMPDDCYYGYRVLADEFIPRWGLTATLVDMSDLDLVRGAMRSGSTLLWAESPSNPLMKICDLRALATLAQEYQARFIVDGTFATPVLQRPIELGADIVLHSTTKYIGGHSDLQGGALIFSKADDLYKRVEHVRHITGGVASPFNSWLALRGVRSLAARMRMHSENALAVARFLEKHPAVGDVFYPGLPKHRGHDVARRQMSAFGGMLSFTVEAGREAALKVVSRVNLFTRATSLGGVESLLEHRQTSEGEGSTTRPDLIRVSVGLEHPDDLIQDLAQALG